jgi:hypothetical protein
MINADEWNASREVIEGRNEWGPIPATDEFLHPRRGYEKPDVVRGWEWSTTFGQWGAFVMFNDWHGFTWPKNH